MEVDNLLVAKINDSKNLSIKTIIFLSIINFMYCIPLWIALILIIINIQSFTNFFSDIDNNFDDMSNNLLYITHVVKNICNETEIC